MISLAWPPAVLRGHAKGRSHWPRSNATASCRRAAHGATMAATLPAIPAEGDIALTVELTPPNNRGDRQNSEAACKAYLDGIADGLKVNDKRFSVTWVHKPAAKPGSVVVTIGGEGATPALAPDDTTASHQEGIAA